MTADFFISHNMKAIDVVFPHPERQTIKRCPHRNLPCEVYVQQYLDAIFMKCTHAVLQFPHGVRCCRIGTPGRKIISRSIAPVILLSRQRLHRRTLFFHNRQRRRLVDGHQLYLIDAKLLQVGDLFLQALKSTLSAHLRARVPGEIAHVQVVHHSVLPGNIRLFIRLPVVSRKRHSAADICPALCIFFLRTDESRIGIARDLPVDSELIRALFPRHADDLHGAQSADRRLIRKRLLLHKSAALFVVQQKVRLLPLSRGNGKPNPISLLYGAGCTEKCRTFLYCPYFLPVLQHFLILSVSMFETSIT